MEQERPTAQSLKNIDRASAFLKGLASGPRLLILCELADGEKTVGALISATGIAPTSMSQHLGKLRQEGIVAVRRDHRTLYYAICHESVAGIMQILHQTFCKEDTQ